MIAEYVLLAGRIRRELAELEQVIGRALRAGQVALGGHPDSDLFVDAAALNLHDFYTGLERIFQQVAAVIDETTPTGPEWHRDLLEQMCIELPGARPVVFSRETCRALSDFMRFRHVVRNVYAYNLNPQRVMGLAEEATKLFTRVKSELEQFAAFLEQVGRED